MQIGKPDLDAVCSKAMVPALRACGLDPKRVDKHNEGRLLNSEIAAFIKSSNIVVADLTNERPNCYLEVGYTMGLGKFENLILTAREDHNIDSPNHKKGGPKIHFDLSGYDILWWHPENLDDFRLALEKKVKYRIAKLPAIGIVGIPDWNEKWFSLKRDQGISGFRSLVSGNISGHMEIRITLPNSKLDQTQQELLQVAKKCEIHTFGWPLGVVLDKEKDRPRPETDGIYAEIAITPPQWSYDYWAIKRDGSFYLLQSLHEDVGNKGQIWVSTRIYRITEAFLYSLNIYTKLGLDVLAPIAIRIEHGGLKNRLVGSPRFEHYWKEYRSDVGEISSEVFTSIKEIETNLVDLVGKVVRELFAVFDFFTVDGNELKKIVSAFKEGKTI